MASRHEPRSFDAEPSEYRDTAEGNNKEAVGNSHVFMGL
jgi:hypothetical protein